MTSTSLLFCFLFFAVFSASAQSKKKPKKWQIIVMGKQLRARAYLQNVTDSSIVLAFGNGPTKEISFKTITKIKLKPRYYSGVAAGAASFFLEGIAGGIIIGTAFSKGKTGEPAAMSGVVGGVGGGLAVGFTSAILNPLILDKLVSKKFYVHQDSVSYQSLKLRLKPYCLIQ
jgi:hypothetical protein